MNKIQLPKGDLRKRLVAAWTKRRMSGTSKPPSRLATFLAKHPEYADTVESVNVQQRANALKRSENRWARKSRAVARNPKFKTSTVQIAFLDELEKISLQMPSMASAANYVKGIPQRTGQFIRNIPQETGKFVRSVPQRMAQGVQNTGTAIGRFGTPVKSLREGWQATWNPQGASSRHLAFVRGMTALGAYQGVQSVRPKEDPTGLGRSRTHRALRSIGEQVGGIIAAPVPGFAGPMVGSLVGGKVGDVAGRTVDRLRGYKTPPHLPPPPQGQV